jgi:hypothetical protein
MCEKLCLLGDLSVVLLSSTLRCFAMFGGAAKLYRFSDGCCTEEQGSSCGV